MNAVRLTSAALLSLFFPLCLPGAADFSSYRGFRFGSNLETAARQAGLEVSAAKPIHQRPALIQELEWRPPSSYQTEATVQDPVRDSLLRFYNGELFQIVSTYDANKVEGMKEEDMVEAISSAYGTATKPRVEIPYHSNYGEAAVVLARWEDTQYAYSLVRTGDKSSFALILSDKRLNLLAQAAINEAVRLDLREAPQREAALQKMNDEKERLVLEKARISNRPGFRP